MSNHSESLEPMFFGSSRWIQYISIMYISIMYARYESNKKKKFHNSCFRYLNSFIFYETYLFDTAAGFMIIMKIGHKIWT